MATKIQIRRGAGTPPNDLLVGELAYDTLNKKLYVGTGDVNAPYQEIGSVDTLAELGITASAQELNVLDESLASTTDLNRLANYSDKLVYLANVTADVVTLLNAKAATNHPHGHILSDGSIEEAALISQNDRLIINDSSDGNLIKKSTIAFTTNGTGYLKQDGTWGNPDTDTDTTYTVATSDYITQSGQEGAAIGLTDSGNNVQSVVLSDGDNIVIDNVATNRIKFDLKPTLTIKKLGLNQGSNNITFQYDVSGTTISRNLNVNSAGVLQYNNNVVWHAGNDGGGTGLNADLLDGFEASYFLPTSHDMTLTLSGDASGSATFTNMGNATLSVAIADDSHNHTISNIDNLQTSLNAKANVDSPAFVGIPTATDSIPIGDVSNRLATTAYVQSVAFGGIVLDQQVEWTFVGYSLDPTDGYSGGADGKITVSSNDLGQNFDWYNYDYKFVFAGSVNTEDNSALKIYFDDITTQNKYSWLYNATRIGGTSSASSYIGADNGSGPLSNQILTGLGIDTSSANGELTGVNCEFIVSRTQITPSAGMPGWSVQGTGSGHYFPSTQTLSTAYDGAVLSNFTGTFRQDNLISSVTIDHGLLNNTTSNVHNIVNVYRRRKMNLAT